MGSLPEVLLRSFLWWLELLGILAGFVGCVMALPPLLQMIYGTPQPEIGFGIENRPASYRLTGELSNPPIAEGFLHSVGVTRTTANDLFTSFGIWEAGTKRPFINSQTAVINSWNGIPAARVSLPATKIPFLFYIVDVDSKGIARELGTMSTAVIPPGEYIVIVEIAYDGKSKKAERRLKIQSSVPYASWM